MTPKTFAALGALAAVSLLAASATYSISSRWQPSETDSRLAFPGLVDRVNHVVRVRVEGDGPEIEIAREGDLWVMASHGGFAADAAKVRANIVGVAELRRLEPKTERPELFPRIEVEDPSLEGAKSRQFSMLDIDGSALASLIVGKRKVGVEGAGRDGAYVRIDGEERAWLVGGKINISLDLADWTDTLLFDLEVPDIVRMQTLRGDAYPIELVRAEGENAGYSIVSLPEGTEPTTNYALQSIVRRSIQVRFDDVRAATDTGEPAAVTEINTVDGVTITASFGERTEDGARWVRLEAAGEGDAADTARGLNDRYGGFEMRVPPRDAETLVVKLGDVVKTEGS